MTVGALLLWCRVTLLSYHGDASKMPIAARLRPASYCFRVTEGESIMNRMITLTLTTVTILGSGIILSSTDAAAQQKQRDVFKLGLENSKYTQQHVIDVGDVPGHQVRIFEIYRTYPNNSPMINGVKLKETWNRGLSDYIDGNGPNLGYSVFVHENGDKFFARTTTLAQSPGSGKLTRPQGPDGGANMAPALLWGKLHYAGSL